MMAVRILLCAMLLFMLASCGPPWVRVEGAASHVRTSHFKVDLPVDWMKYVRERDTIFLSRDGTGLQYITISSDSHEETFKPINKVSRQGMLPLEFAELVVALIKNQHGMTPVEVLENNPALVSGKDGIRVHVAFASERGLNYDGVVYGVLDDQRVYLLSFYGTRLHYFPRDLPVFETVVSSFRLN